MHFAHARHTASFVQCGTATHYIAVHQSAQTDVSRRTTAMLFSGIIAAIVARVQAHRAHKQRRRGIDRLDDHEPDEHGPGHCDIEVPAPRA